MRGHKSEQHIVSHSSCISNTIGLVLIAWFNYFIVSFQMQGKLENHLIHLLLARLMRYTIIRYTIMRY